MSKSELEVEIQKRLTNHFSPEELQIVDESQNHAGHAGVAATGGAHIRIAIKSKSIEGLTRVEKHRKINACLEDLLKSNQIHALSIKIL